MSSKTRKFIWSVPVVAAFAVIGALAVFVALGIQNAAPVEAQSTGPYTISVTGGGPGSGFPSAPRNLLVTVLDADSVRLAWDHPTDQRGTRDVPVIQQVEQSERPDASTVWDPTTISPAATADSVSVTVTGLSDDEEYFFSVQSTTSTGSGDRAVIGPVTPKDIAVPSAPSNVRAVPGTVATALSVSWDAPDSQGDAPITAYSATVTLTSDDTEVSGATVTVNVEQRTATITGLAANTEYTVSVTANNAGGPSPAAEATATTTLLPTAEITNDPSTTGSAGLRLVLKIEADGIQEMAAGDRVEVFLENDYAVPSSISISSVSFIIGSGATPNNANAAYGSTISAASVSVADGGDIPGTDTDGDAHSIVAEIPDFDPRDDNRYFPNASPVVSDTLTLVIETSAGIKNPSEQGKHSVGYSVLTGVETADGTAERKLPDLETKAKISLDSDDGGRGDEVIITGSGFNNGTIAEAYVLKEPGAEPGCQTIIDKGTSLGTADVGSDDKFSIAFNVHQDDFDPGNINYICASDSEAPNNRLASAVKPFDLTPSVTFDPTAVNSGDEVTVKPRDFGGDITSINLGGEVALDSDDWTEDGSDLLFYMPGGLSGTVNVSVTDGTDTQRVDIVVTPSGLVLSKSEVAPNETIIISGTGFSENSTILVSEIKIDGVALVVDSAGTRGTGDARYIQTTSSGEFTATVSVWHASVCDPPNSTETEDCSSNPALGDGTYTVKATDAKGFEGSASITVLEPSLSVNPAVASPRDYITISGANWPISTSSVDNDVNINVDDRDRSASLDSTGRFNYSYQLSGDINIGSSHTITVTYDGGTGGDIEEEIDFEVPESNVVLSPGAAVPGQTISLEITGMPIYSLVKHVKIDGADRLDISFNTDSDGNVTVTGILVPFLDPGFYPVEVGVGTNPDDDLLGACPRNNVLNDNRLH